MGRSREPLRSLAAADNQTAPPDLVKPDEYDDDAGGWEAYRLSLAEWCLFVAVASCWAAVAARAWRDGWCSLVVRAWKGEV